MDSYYFYRAYCPWYNCNHSRKKDDKEALERLNKQTQSIKNCVETLGNGVYKDQSLSWKLDNCNASK
jgi:hypothetical protein